MSQLTPTRPNVGTSHGNFFRYAASNSNFLLERGRISQCRVPDVVSYVEASGCSISKRSLGTSSPPSRPTRARATWASFYDHMLPSLSCTDSSGSPCQVSAAALQRCQLQKPGHAASLNNGHVTQLCEGIERVAKAVLAHETDLKLNSATTSPTTSCAGPRCGNGITKAQHRPKILAFLALLLDLNDLL